MLGAGTQIAGYLIEGVLGKGGMGVVYDAYQPALERHVALKVLVPELVRDTTFKTRFRREAITQARLDHPHIVPVYEVGETEEGLFIAMRLIRGQTLKELITSRSLSAERAVDLLAPVAAALDVAHARRCVHRDIKPQNVLVSDEGHPFLTDFGLTKDSGEPSLTEPGRFMGTPAYVAPEQIRGEATQMSDIYALGAVLFECLTGSPPFRASTTDQAIAAHLTESPPKVSERRGDLPEPLDAIMERALAKDPARRPGTAGELVAQARRALAPTGGPAEIATLASAPDPAPASAFQGHADRSPTGEAAERSERDLLLGRVAQSYDTYLTQSLRGVVRLDLELEVLPGATRRPADRILPVPRRATHPVGTSLLDIFDELGGVNGDGLLVLGEPGAGKTTLLVQLAAALADRARRDPREPVPVYLPLSSWAVARGPLDDWIVAELAGLYKIPPDFGRRAVSRSAPMVMPLLDGLDELVDHDARRTCVAEINRLASGYPVPIVVTSRRAEYEALDISLELELGVRIRPLAAGDVLARLREGDTVARRLVDVVERDSSLVGLLQAPLLVNMLTLAYGAGHGPDLRSSEPDEGWLDHLIDDYLDRRLELDRVGGGGNAAYPVDRTRRWLSALAGWLAADRQTIFLLERMQPGLLPSRAAQWCVRASPKLVFGVAAGLITFAVSGPVSDWLGFEELPALHIVLWSLFGIAAAVLQGRSTVVRLLSWAGVGFASGLVFALLVGIRDAEGLVVQGLYYVVIFGLVGELVIWLMAPEIRPAERLSWSWSRSRRYVAPGLLVGLIAGPLFGLLFSLSIEGQGASATARDTWLLVFGPAFGLLWAMSRGIGWGLAPAPTSTRTTPNEGITRSARHGLIVGGMTLLAVCGVGLLGCVTWLLLGDDPDSGESVAMIMLLTGGWGLGTGLLLGIGSGGGAAIQHWTLRIFLWWYGLAPLRYTRWLSYAVHLRVLYWGVGGGHMFIHRVVQEHFAKVTRSS